MVEVFIFNNVRVIKRIRYWPDTPATHRAIARIRQTYSVLARPYMPEDC
jgi:hypothetical protein